MTSAESQSSPWTPEKITSSETLLNVKLSQDGSKVLYQVKPAFRDGEHATSSLWIADTDKADSARQLTSGLFNDTTGVFHPDGQRVVFLSDRQKAGGPSQRYALSLTGGEAVSLFGKDNKRGVSAFEISPNGRYIAFTSSDEPTAEDEKREKEKDDASVFGDKKGLERLRLHTFTSGDVRSLNVSQDRHVFTFTWKSDSREIMFCTMQHDALEFIVDRTPLEKIVIAKGDFSPQLIGTYSRAPAGSIIWKSNGDVVDMQAFDPPFLSDADAVFVHSSNSFSKPCRLYGETEDAVSVVDLKSNDLVAVEVATGLDSRIDVLDGEKCVFSLFQTDREVIQEWDAKRLEDGTFIFAAIRHSAFTQQPLNVWSGKVHGEKALLLDTKLSSHFQWLLDAPTLKTDVLQWKAADGTGI